MPPACGDLLPVSIQNPDGHAAARPSQRSVAHRELTRDDRSCPRQSPATGHQVTGTLKSVLATRTSPVTFIVLSSLYPFARGTVDGLIYLLGGGAFGLPLGQVNLLATLLLFGVSLLVFGSIGILSATFTLIFKRGDPLLWLFVSLSWLLGGVFYPREVLPPFLQQLAHLLPITYTIDAMRAALLEGSTVAEIFPQIRALALFAFVGVPVSLVGFHLGVRRARVTGRRWASC